MPQQTSASAYERAPRLIDVGNGHRIAVEVSGHGPTVVLEPSGPGYGIDLWGDLPARLAEFATVVVYDRLGVGYSETWTRPPTPAEHADNLARLLDALPVARPVLLVGWSMGGMMAQNFAARFPQDVAGVLLLDPTIFVRDQYAGMPALSRWVLPRLSKFFGQRMARQVRRPGFKTSAARARLVKQLSAGFGPRMEPRISSHLVETLTSRADVHVATSELAHSLFQTTAEVARTIEERGLPDVPVTLVMSGYLPANTPKSTLSMLRKMQAEQEKIAVERGYELRKLGDVSHQIPLEACDDCVSAVRDLLAKIDKSERTPR